MPYIPGIEAAILLQFYRLRLRGFGSCFSTTGFLISFSILFNENMRARIIPPVVAKSANKATTAKVKYPRQNNAPQNTKNIAIVNPKAHHVSFFIHFTFEKDLPGEDNSAGQFHFKNLSISGCRLYAGGI
jgi:hypothetical protein